MEIKRKELEARRIAKEEEQKALAAKAEAIEEQARQNPLFWGMVVTAHYLKRDSPLFHLEVVEAVQSNLNTVIQAPRGSAKSTLLTLIYPCHGIFYKKYHFIIIVQNTFKKAAATLDNIKSEFRENPKLLAFGIGFLKDAEGDTIFIHRDGFKTRIICKGADQLGTIRGERFGSFRPDLILIDDLEDDELVKNPERRQDLEKQFNEVLKYAGEMGITKTIMIGTILHDDSLLAKLLTRNRYTNFKKMFYMARYEWKQEDKTVERESLWPQKWSVEDLDEMERQDPEGFAKEMQGDPSSGSLETIRRDDFRYWKVENNQIILLNKDGSHNAKWNFSDCRAAIAVDLAWEDKKVSDYSAIVPGLVTPGNDLLVGEYVAKRGLRPDDLEGIIFDMSKRYSKLTGKRVQVGFEKAKLEKVMKWFLSEAQRRRNDWLWLVDVNWGTKDKIERVMARLGNRYAQNAVYHKSGMGDLENQLIRLRSTPHDDLADALSMIPEMLAFASKKKKETPKSDMFEFMRKQTDIYRNKNKLAYVFGQKERQLPFRTASAISFK